MSLQIRTADRIRKLAESVVVTHSQPPSIRAEVLDQNVGFLQEGQQNLSSLLAGQIEANRSLVAIDPAEVGGVAVVKRRSPIPHLIALRRLDFDDVGTMIRQLRGERSTQYSG